MGSRRAAKQGGAAAARRRGQGLAWESDSDEEVTVGGITGATSSADEDEDSALGGDVGMTLEDDTTDRPVRAPPVLGSGARVARVPVRTFGASWGRDGRLAVFRSSASQGAPESCVRREGCRLLCCLRV